MTEYRVSALTLPGLVQVDRRDSGWLHQCQALRAARYAPTPGDPAQSDDGETSASLHQYTALWAPCRRIALSGPRSRPWRCRPQLRVRQRGFKSSVAVVPRADPYRPPLFERAWPPFATGRHRMRYGFDYYRSGLRPVRWGPIQFGRKLPGSCRDAGKGAANSARHRARDGIHPRNASNAVLWSGRWESNPRSQLGRLGLYH